MQNDIVLQGMDGGDLTLQGFAGNPAVAPMPTPAIVDASPGNRVFIPIANTTPGPGANVMLTAQGLITPVDLALFAAFTTAGVTVTIPDGAQSSDLIITDDANVVTTVGLRVDSQYVQAAEYAASGEGVDLTAFAIGELDNVLRKASGYADLWMGGTRRLLQMQEQHRWRDSRRVYPHRFPIVSIDQFQYVISNAQFQNFDVKDVIIVKGFGYGEILTWAIGSYALVGAISTLGYDAQIVNLTYTAGWKMTQFPNALRSAVVMIATEMIVWRGIQNRGFGGLSRVREGISQYDRRSESFQMPAPAMDLLRPFAVRTIR